MRKGLHAEIEADIKALVQGLFDKALEYYYRVVEIYSRRNEPVSRVEKCAMGPLSNDRITSTLLNCTSEVPVGHICDSVCWELWETADVCCSIAASFDSKNNHQAAIQYCEQALGLYAIAQDSNRIAHRYGDSDGDKSLPIITPAHGGILGGGVATGVAAVAVGGAVGGSGGISGADGSGELSYLSDRTQQWHHSNSASVASCYRKLAEVYARIGEVEKALNFHGVALKLLLSALGAKEQNCRGLKSHGDLLRDSYVNMLALYDKLGIR